jgi:hypothetical protein
VWTRISATEICPGGWAEKATYRSSAGVTVPGRMSVRKGETEQAGRLAGDRCLDPDLSIKAGPWAHRIPEPSYATQLGQISWRDVIRTRGALTAQRLLCRYSSKAAHPGSQRRPTKPVTAIQDQPRSKISSSRYHSKAARSVATTSPFLSVNGITDRRFLRIDSGK